jgi:DNA-binding MarR family transcriptional regulator
VSIRYHSPMSVERFDSLVSCLSRALQSEQRREAVDAGVPAVQWAILHYVRDANRYSNTPQALTEFLGLTKGTVSQSLNRLAARGWVRREADPRDGRIVRLVLTCSGQRRAEGDAGEAWRAAIGSLTVDEREGAEAALAKVLVAWQRRRDGRTFGVCHSCRHFRPGESGHQCGLTGEPLSDDDSRRICREHALPQRG